MKIRASQAGKLMVEPRTKKAKEAGELSETSKSFLDELAIEKHYQRRKVVRTDEMRKGIECEEQAITMLQRQVGEGLFKNEDRYEDEHFTGEPDLISSVVYDTKVPYDIWTFHKAEPPILETGKKTLYYWQLQVYMALTGKSHACLAYCLVDTPEMMLDDILYRAQFKFDGGEDNPECQDYKEELEKAHRYSDIPEEQRVKLFPVERNDEDIDALREKVSQARDYVENWRL